jgi:hypothetical protein
VVQEWVYGIKFDFGSARSEVVRDRPELSYRRTREFDIEVRDKVCRTRCVFGYRTGQVTELVGGKDVESLCWQVGP